MTVSVFFQNVSGPLFILIGARVGLEQVFYNVAENIGFVELCAVVYEPVIDCPIEFPFAVQLSTTNNTAGMTV